MPYLISICLCLHYLADLAGSNFNLRNFVTANELLIEYDSILGLELDTFVMQIEALLRTNLLGGSQYIDQLILLGNFVSRLDIDNGLRLLRENNRPLTACILCHAVCAKYRNANNIQNWTSAHLFCHYAVTCVLLCRWPLYNYFPLLYTLQYLLFLH